VPPGEEKGVQSGLLAVRARRQDETQLIELEGELDLASADALEQALDAALADGERPVVVDMTALSFIDSTGIALLIATLSRPEAGPRLRFVPSREPAVIRVLALTGVDRRLPLLEDSAAGVTAGETPEPAA
jgi:anti-anti-sigma factor